MFPSHTSSRITVPNILMAKRMTPAELLKEHKKRAKVMAGSKVQL